MNIFHNPVRLGGMTPAERAAGRYMRGPEGHPAFPVLDGKSGADAGKAVRDWLDSRVATTEGKARELDCRLESLEQKSVRRGGPAEGGESPGAQFAAHVEELKEIASASGSGRRATFGLETKTTITTAVGSGGGMHQADRDPMISMISRRPLRVRNLLPVMPISSSSVEVVKQTARMNNAATVPETSLKPESAYGWSIATVTPKVIAHWVPASKQILEDVPQLQAMIDDELLFGLGDKEDAQILLGDGLGKNLLGLVASAIAYSPPFALTGTPTKIDRVASGLLQVMLANYNPTGIVVHPSDWLRIKLTKDTSGHYVLTSLVSDGIASGATGLALSIPGFPSAPTLWGLPVVATTAMTQGKFLVGDFVTAAKIYDRWTPRIEVSTEHADFFIRNMVAILAEERIALAIKRADAMVYGDFSADA